MHESQYMPAINHKNKLESSSYDDGKKVKLNDLLQADIVLSTDSFLGSKRYADEVS